MAAFGGLDGTEALQFWEQRIGNIYTAVPWTTFLIHLRAHMGSASHFRQPSAAPVERIMRYAMGRGGTGGVTSQNHPEGSTVLFRDFDLFVRRFGPFSVCLLKAEGSLLDSRGVLVEWFHGNMERAQAEAILVGQCAGSFLIRYSSLGDVFGLSYITKSCSVKHSKLFNLGMMGFSHLSPAECAGGSGPNWPTIKAFVEHNVSTLTTPVRSQLNLDSEAEVMGCNLPDPAPPPSNNGEEEEKEGVNQGSEKGTSIIGHPGSFHNPAVPIPPPPAPSLPPLRRSSSSSSSSSSIGDGGGGGMSSNPPKLSNRESSSNGIACNSIGSDRIGGGGLGSGGGGGGGGGVVVGAGTPLRLSGVMFPQKAASFKAARLKEAKTKFNGVQAQLFKDFGELSAPKVGQTMDGGGDDGGGASRGGGGGENGEDDVKEALAAIDEVVEMIKGYLNDETAQHLHAKCYRLKGDIFTRLKKMDKAVEQYNQCLVVIERALSQADDDEEGGVTNNSTCAFNTMLSHVHRQLALYYMTRATSISPPSPPPPPPPLLSPLPVRVRFMSDGGVLPSPQDDNQQQEEQRQQKHQQQHPGGGEEDEDPPPLPLPLPPCSLSSPSHDTKHHSFLLPAPSIPAPASTSTSSETSSESSSSSSTLSPCGGGMEMALELQMTVRHHYSQMMAYTTDSEDRSAICKSWKEKPEFMVAITGINEKVVKEKLDEGREFYRQKNYGDALTSFTEAVVMARCCGAGKLEATALGNLATVNKRQMNLNTAITQYKVCLQLLRQLGDTDTEKKILNYLVLSCMEAKKWTLAKRWNDQLLNVCVCRENMVMLKDRRDEIKRCADEQRQQRSPL